MEQDYIRLSRLVYDSNAYLNSLFGGVYLKKSLIIASVFVLALLGYGIITSQWESVYYISGGLVLACIGITLFTYLDKLILGDKGRAFTNEEKRDKRSDVIKQYVVASGVIIVAAIVGFLLK